MDNFKSFQNLFNHVKTILEIKQKTNHNRCNDFTVFTALRNETDEKNAHTTFLYEILRPNGTHGMGDAFLKDFFSTVLKIDNYDSSASIYKEFDYNLSDDNSGRIDLLIETSSARYPIEIKIYAGDQERQVSRYNEFAKKKSDISKVYYLTLNGYLPSEKSLDNLDAEDVICVSFAKEIYTWLKNCVVVANQNHAQDVAVAIQQYQTLLMKLTDGQQDDAYMDAIKKTISASRENYECAVAIAGSLVSLRTEKLKELFKDISDYLRNNKLIKKHLSENEHREYSSLYNEDNEDLKRKIENYYPSCRNTYPGLRIEIKRKDKIRVFLEIEVDTTLYYGVTVLDKDMNEITSQNLKKGVRDIFDNDDWKAYAVEFCKICKKSKRWIWYKCLPEEDTPLILRECPELYENMYDDKGYKDILNEITKKLGDNLKRILEKGCARE